MSERVDDFVDRMGRYEETAREAQRETAQGALTQAQKDARKRQIEALNETRRTAGEGTPPAQVFGEDDAAICAAFIDRMAQHDFPGSKLLENKVTYENPVRGFLRRAMRKDPVEQSAIRGYQVGMVYVAGRQSPSGPEEHPAYLCEDGKIRTRELTRLLPRPSEDDSYRIQISDLPLDLETGQLAQVELRFRSHSPDEWGEASVYKNVGRMLESTMMSSTFKDEMAARSPEPPISLAA